MTLRPRLVWMTTPEALVPTHLSEGRCDAVARNSASVAMSSRSTAWLVPSSTAVRTSSTASRLPRARGVRCVPRAPSFRGSLSSSSIEGSERRSSRSDWFGMALPFSPVPKSRSFPPSPRPVSSRRRRGQCLSTSVIFAAFSPHAAGLRRMVRVCGKPIDHASCAEGADRRRMHENPQYYGAKAG